MIDKVLETIKNMRNKKLELYGKVKYQHRSQRVI